MKLTILLAFFLGIHSAHAADTAYRTLEQRCKGSEQCYDFFKKQLRNTRRGPGTRSTQVRGHRSIEKTYCEIHGDDGIQGITVSKGSSQVFLDAIRYPNEGPNHLKHKVVALGFGCSFESKDGKMSQEINQRLMNLLGQHSVTSSFEVKNCKKDLSSDKYDISSFEEAADEPVKPCMSPFEHKGHKILDACVGKHRSGYTVVSLKAIANGKSELKRYSFELTPALNSTFVKNFCARNGQGKASNDIDYMGPAGMTCFSSPEEIKSIVFQNQLSTKIQGIPGSQVLDILKLEPNTQPGRCVSFVSSETMEDEKSDYQRYKYGAR